MYPFREFGMRKMRRAVMLSKRGILLVGGLAIFAAIPASDVRCDDFGCDGNFCDADHPCNRGCKCVYPVPGKVGHCEVWYRK
jgi:hypothetical protein